MERPEDLRRRFVIGIVVLFHFVGLIGLYLPPSRIVFLQMVPYHLLLMMIVIAFTHQNFNSRFVIFILLIWAVGYIAEWIGVHKAWLFGSYIYGDTLGTKLNDIPLIIGINWFLLIYSTGVLMQRSRLKSSWLRILTGAILLVILDRLIEPTAMSFNYWEWAGNIIPGKNYICWFLISGVLLTIFERFKFKKQSIIAVVFLIMQFVFFGVLFIAYL
jgi:putative membrane protein